ncbi:MAG TPA: hypothetical protein VFK89_04480 [Actinomycetota bacterium]|nr:hypothetical protein [Actinomycetota bacterium]
MRDAIVFETHPAVRSGLERRLDAEPDVMVLDTFCDVDLFVEAVRRLEPAVAVVGLFGPHGVEAANGAALVAKPGTSVIAVVPYLWPETARRLGRGVTLVQDGPRGHRLAAEVRSPRPAAPSFG